MYSMLPIIKIIKKYMIFFFVIIFLHSFLLSKSVIAILDLEAIGVDTNDVKIITDRLKVEISRSERFVVLERSQIDKILSKKKFQYSGCIKTECAVEIGQMLNTDYIVIGSIGKIGNVISFDINMVDVESNYILDSYSFSSDGDISMLLTDGVPSIIDQLNEESDVGILKSSISNSVGRNLGRGSYTDSYNKYIIRDMAIASIIPGAIQLAKGENLKSALLASFELFGIAAYFYNTHKGREVQEQYQGFANENWSFARWLDGYYDYRGSPDFGILFNFPDGTNNPGPCGGGPFGNASDGSDLYPCIDEGHGLAYTISINAQGGGRQYTNSSDFEEVYEFLCGVDDSDGDGYTIDETCNNEEQIIDELLVENGFEIYLDQHHYENIGKYDPFFAGWSDSEQIYEYEKSNGDKLAMSPSKREYRDIWSDFNEGYLRYASYSLTLVTINHFVSMLDVLVSSTTNNNVGIKAESNFNKFDLYKIKLSLKL